MGDTLFGRLFVCDPACVQAFGHNVTALNYFKEAFCQDFKEVIAVCCRHLAPEVATRCGFVRFYRYYYNGFLNDNYDEDLGAGCEAVNLYYLDPLERLATEDAERLISEYNINHDDTVLFPHLDFYGVAGLCNALAKVSRDHHPRVLLRFIGVMENATAAYRNPTKELIRRILVCQEEGTTIGLSAECPRLADLLSSELSANVPVTPFPNRSEPLPMPEGGAFRVLCPGSARADKGFLHLHRIFSDLRYADPDCTVQFVTQTLPYSVGRSHQDYTSKLYAIPGVTLLPSAISEGEMVDQFLACCAVLLPYDVETYRYRGSAAMMESACFARPVITLDRTAFADQVRYYSLGEVVDTIEQMPASLLRLARQPRQLIGSRARQARFRFTADVSAAYDHWLRAGS